MHGISGTTWDDNKSGESGGIFPYPAFELFRKSDSVFSSVFAYWKARRLKCGHSTASGDRERLERFGRLLSRA
jgi:hypothetical protein